MVKKMDSSDYGFFCDVETAIINDYENVEYYVEITRTRYEVRRKIIKPVEIKEEFPNEMDEKLRDNELCCVAPEEKRDVSTGCFTGIWKRISRIPKDVYYSFAVCSITASCIVLVMTH